jgi:hypothetical protein
VRAILKLEQLESIAQVFLQRKRADQIESMQKHEISQIRKMISSLNYAFRKLKSDDALSSYQAKFMDDFGKLQQILEETMLHSRDESIQISLWEAMDNGSVVYLALRSIILDSQLSSRLRYGSPLPK